LDKAYIKWIIEEVPGDGSAWSHAIGNVVKALWADKNMQAVFAMRGRWYHLNDTAN